jgi:hypothetical protein
VVGTRATFGFATRNGRTMADNAPEVMMSLVTGTAVPSGLKPSVAKGQCGSGFPYVVPEVITLASLVRLNILLGQISDGFRTSGGSRSVISGQIIRDHAPICGGDGSGAPYVACGERLRDRGRPARPAARGHSA